jgi:ATP synthase protein I
MADTNRRRGLKLLAGGAVGGLVGGGVAVVAMAAAFRPDGGVIASLGVGAVLTFFALGQLMQVLFAEAPPVLVMFVTMLSYVIRVVGLGICGWFLVSWQPQLPTMALGIAMIITVAGWLSAEIWVFTHLRIPAFDAPQAKTN